MFLDVGRFCSLSMYVRVANSRINFIFIFLLISISKDRITKARRFSQETTKKLGSSKEVNRNGKKKP